MACNVDDWASLQRLESWKNGEEDFLPPGYEPQSDEFLADLHMMLRVAKSRLLEKANG